MAQVSITQLPQAQALDGTESVPIVQGGVTVQTTTSQIAGAGALNYPFLTVGTTAGLTQARYMSAGTGLSLTDNGAGSTLQINLTGAAASLNSSGTGIQVKTGTNTLTPRSITVSSGLTIANGDGVSGNPLISLDTFFTSLQSMSASTGLLGISSGVFNTLSINGTSGKISVSNGNGASGNPTIDLVTTGVSAGQYGNSLAIPIITVDAYGRITTVTTTSLGVGGTVTQVNTGNGLLGGPITTVGTITIDDTVVATLTSPQTLTNKSMSGSTNTFTNIPNAALTNSSITIGTTAVSLGGTITTFDGTSINGTTNTISNIANASLINSSLTLGTTTTSLGATSLSLAGLTSVTVTQNPTTDYQLATKQYVDNLYTTGIHYHQPVKYEVPDTTGNLNATYNQPGGPGVGVGATLTNAGTLTAFAPDGPVASVGDRVLIYNQTNAFENGVYTVTVVGDGSTAWVLTRATDADTYSPTSTTALGAGDAFFVTSGNTGAGETYACTTVGTIVFGTTAITFSQISSTQVYSAGTGLTLTGTQFSLTAPVTAVLGGTGSTSYTTGDMLYASSSTALAKLGIGTSTYIMTSSGAAPQWSNPSGVSVGAASNTAITLNSTNATNYLTFVSGTTGDLPQLVNSSITCNPSTGSLTDGIKGGAF